MKQLATINLKFANQNLLLTNQRALFWETQNALVLSDLHIGKSATFRKNGIPISQSVLIEDLQRLKILIDQFKAEKLIIVGDLFHAELNKDIDYFKDWLLQFDNLKLQLIIGNHDRLSETLYEDLNIDIFKPSLNLSPFTFVHDLYECEEDEFYISGHIHPGYVLKGKGKQFIKLPCYQVFDNHIVLPAFSKFTGLNTNKTDKKCTNIVFTEDAIFKI
ncbi:ICC-like protein phosphoesterase [Mesoflavibacter sp. HG96]|uniref:Ligase-associated DNA damage response endonuclease PdeM n=1 Tax=Mesoflavibacter profundi TaxID=2708110 RepID=A0ABT4RXN0_9FLAO|nr:MULTISPECIES: ligase-associated DNA damage response endonuclease PdeM [Mesoflavibacter]MDA0176537.1 ligase-associated DNA damage response endonuclease PdeM [Mesoflavibacter profundi]QIJ90192.1 ICC-like protein phosphoesterase [Mesoflavibacter sp. HG96]QIJ92920.1 ICC-like protein phosphoesterase [Mesoflavibacter sp. HG37]